MSKFEQFHQTQRTFWRRAKAKTDEAKKELASMRENSKKNTGQQIYLLDIKRGRKNS